MNIRVEQQDFLFMKKFRSEALMVMQRIPNPWSQDAIGSTPIAPVFKEAKPK